MDDARMGLLIRGLRVRRGWRQQDLAARSGVSRQVVSLIELGCLDAVSLPRLRDVARSLGVRVELAPKGAADFDRMLNSGHAALHESIARVFRRIVGWTQVPEVSYSNYGERGVIDVLAWHAASRTVLVVELKTAIVDISDLMGSMDRRRRLAPRIARDRGWDPALVGTWVVVDDTPTNHRRLAEHVATLRTAFPDDGRAIRRWLRDPVGAIAALSFLSRANARGARHDLRSVRRVRSDSAAAR